ncbi:MAG: GNAT family N-acetyltransferase [Rhodoferax sp.]|jgi:GNAT superfamily N-acetyltransferase|nr:GNAT family N-acetyltransferase [Rhodoferax sp.]
MHCPLTKDFVLRSLRHDDSAALGWYFDSLSPASKSRFAPHPLTQTTAQELCATEQSATLRLAIEMAGKIIGYFILEPEMSMHEAARYRQFGIALESGKDFLFAPSVADAFQNRGLASLAMPHLLQLARQSGARSLVLMGGTQATNARAIAFYEKFGFQRFGGYQTELFNHDMRHVLNHAC